MVLHHDNNSCVSGRNNNHVVIPKVRDLDLNNCRWFLNA